MRLGRCSSSRGGGTTLSSMLGGTSRRKEHQWPQRLVQGVPGAVAAKVQPAQAGHACRRLDLDLRERHAAQSPIWGSGPFIRQVQRYEMLQSRRILAQDLRCTRCTAHKF